MKWSRYIPHTFLFFGGLAYALWSFVRRPFPMLGESPLLDLMDYHTPNFYGSVALWYYASPFVSVMLAGLVLISVWKVWLEGHGRDFATFGRLPTWPLSPRQAGPAIVVGEVHHPVQAREISNPSWLTIPERGLYTGVAIFGAVGSGKTSACMHPFARQLLGWQAVNPQLRAAALVLEVKGDVCHDIRRILIDAGRGKDYIELGMKGRWQWNPLSAWWLDSCSLAYTVSSLLNQLFGKGKEPFWQQAYTNLVRWIIELHRIFPERWVTLQQVYRCAIDPELFAAKIEQAEAWSDELNKGTVFVSKNVFKAQAMNLAEWVWKDGPDPKESQAVFSRPMLNKLDKLKLTYRVVWETGPGDEVRERVEAVKRWFVHDWQALDNKIKSSIVEGVSVFLAMFDMPDVAKVFCPPAPEVSDDPQAIAVQARAAMGAEREAQEPDKAPQDGERDKAAPTAGPPVEQERVEGPRHLPPLHELIETGKVLARAVGVMLSDSRICEEYRLVRRLRTRGRNADSHPRSVVEPGIDKGRAFRVQSQRAGDVDRGP